MTLGAAEPGALTALLVAVSYGGSRLALRTPAGD